MVIISNFPGGGDAAVRRELTAHTGNKSNPHGVTAAQAGAVAASDKAALSEAMAGTDDTKYMTPSKTKAAIENIAVPKTRKVNNMSLNDDIQITDNDILTARNDDGTSGRGTLYGNLNSLFTNKVPTSRKVNNKPLTSDITLNAEDVGATTVKLGLQTTAGGFKGGDNSYATMGGAVGTNSFTGNGFAGGSNAITRDANGTAIDAIQLGTGTNNQAKTLQIYDYQLLDKYGAIPFERMSELTPTNLGAAAIDLSNVAPAKFAQKAASAGVGGGKKYATFVVGTSTSGHTAEQVDYLCDGVDDQVEINAAIQALPAGGGKVLILEGTYNITASINVNKDNVTFEGMGNGTILKRMWDSTPLEGVICITSGNSEITNFNINGNNYNDNYHYNYNNVGIYIDGGLNNTVTGNTCYSNSNTGIYIEGGENNTVTGNTCNNNTSNNNTSNNSTSNGVCIGGGENNTVTGNTCNNNNYGVCIEGGDYNTIIGNTCNNNDHDGISTGAGLNTTVTGNTCNNNDDTGISISGGGNNTITGNTCNNNTSNGIYISGDYNTTVTGNTCYSNSNTGISISGGGNNTITGNTCNNNTSNGIYIDGGLNNTVTGNTCIRGTGLSDDYTSSQETIKIEGNNNLVSSNNVMGKNVKNNGSGNTVTGNKYN